MNAANDAQARTDATPRSFTLRALLITLVVILIDQATKIVVLNTMQKGESIRLIGDWLRFTFTENPGMAFGIEYGPPALITIFSIIATGLIILYLRKVGHVYTPYRISLALILGGAIGNIIDRVFYGMIVYDAPLFMGRVVDFIHVNVWRGYVSESVPLIGGKYLGLFPIWNVADMAIVLGVIGILFFQRKFHDRLEEIEQETASADSSAEYDSATIATPLIVGNPGSGDADVPPEITT